MDQRDDAPKFDLSARASDDEDSLQLDPSDLNAPATPASKRSPAKAPVKKNKPSKATQAGLDAKLFEALVASAAPVTMNKSSAAKPNPQGSVPFDVTPEPVFATEPAQPVIQPDAPVEEEPPIPVEVYDGPDTQPEAKPATPIAPVTAETALPVSESNLHEPAEAESAEADASEFEFHGPANFKMFPAAPTMPFPPAEADWEPLPPIATQTVTMRYVPSEYDEPADQEPEAIYQPVILDAHNTDHGLASPVAEELPAMVEEPVGQSLSETPVDAGQADVVVSVEDAPSEPEAPEVAEAIEIAPIEAKSEVAPEPIPLAPEPFEIAATPASPPVRRFYDPAAIQPEDLEPAKPVVARIISPIDDARIAEAVFAPESEPEEELFADGPASEQALAEEMAPEFRIGVKADREPEAEAAVPRGRTGAWWTIPLMCAGLAIVACAVLVPAADENRRAMHELAKIEQDVGYFQKQSEVNKEFLERVATDPTLAERLAMRQLRLTRANSRVVQMPKGGNSFAMSPYALVSVNPPAPLPEYRSISGLISKYFLDTRGQIYLAGLGVLLTAAGVILGGGNKNAVEPAVVVAE